MRNGFRWDPDPLSVRMYDVMSTFAPRHGWMGVGGIPPPAWASEAVDSKDGIWVSAAVTRVDAPGTSLAEGNVLTLFRANFYVLAKTCFATQNSSSCFTLISC